MHINYNQKTLMGRDLDGYDERKLLNINEITLTSAASNNVNPIRKIEWDAQNLDTNNNLALKFDIADKNASADLDAAPDDLFKGSAIAQFVRAEIIFASSGLDTNVGYFDFANSALPATGSGAGSAIQTGDYWYVSVDVVADDNVFGVNLKANIDKVQSIQDGPTGGARFRLRQGNDVSGSIDNVTVEAFVDNGESKIRVKDGSLAKAKLDTALQTEIDDKATEASLTVEEKARSAADLLLQESIDTINSEIANMLTRHAVTITFERDGANMYVTKTVANPTASAFIASASLFFAIGDHYRMIPDDEYDVYPSKDGATIVFTSQILTKENETYIAIVTG